MRRNDILLLLFAPLLLPGLGACGGDDDPVGPIDPPDPVVAVSLSPEAATVNQGGSTTFTATVTGTTNTAVAWTASAGTITPQGGSATFTAPTSAGSITVTVTSDADPTSSASATVTVPEVGITLSAGDPTLSRFEEREMTATVTGTEDTGVSWEGSCDGFEFDADGGQATLQAPGSPATCEVTATSLADPTKSESVTFTVTGDIVVNATDDEDDGRCDQAHCSLREALALTEAEHEADGVTGVILFSDALVGETITLESALPDITWELTVEGPGADDLTIDAAAGEDQDRRVFTIVNAAVTIEGLTLTGGDTRALPTSGPTDHNAGGGAVYIAEESDVTLRGVHVSENTTNSSGGGIVVLDGAHLLVVDSRIERNHGRGFGGGGIFIAGGFVEVVGSTFAENVASPGGGGAIRLAVGELNLRETVITGNRATAFGGGGVMATGSAAHMHMEDFVVEGNRLEPDPNGPPQAIVGGGGISAYNGAALTLVRGDISNNGTTGPGGGVFAHGVADVTDVVVRGNRAGLDGGGIFGNALQSSRFERVTVAENESVADGGGMALNFPLSEILIENSTISGNQARNGAAVRMWTNVRFVNVTIAGNESTPDDPDVGGAVAIVPSTAANPTRVRFTNVLMAGNLTDGSPRNCVVLTPPEDTDAFTSEGNNLSDDESCEPWLDEDDLHGVDAGLDDELADHGGLTPTHALLEGSAAIGAGNPDTCPDTDQRGLARADGCDIGAYQFGASAPMISRYLTSVDRTLSGFRATSPPAGASSPRTVR